MKRNKDKVARCFPGERSLFNKWWLKNWIYHAKALKKILLYTPNKKSYNVSIL